jgi:hypothetical protein
MKLLYAALLFALPLAARAVGSGQNLGVMRLLFGRLRLADRRERRRGEQPPGGLPWVTISSASLSHAGVADVVHAALSPGRRNRKTRAVPPTIVGQAVHIVRKVGIE